MRLTNNGSKNTNSNWWGNFSKLALSCLILGLVVSLWGCSDRLETSLPASNNSSVATASLKQLKEVAPPETIQQLHQILEVKQPQVNILSPQPEQILTDTQVAVKLQVTDLPIFQDEDLKLGSHLEVILDNQDAQSIYDLEKPLIFSNLAAGSHTLRVFASYPWHESFKNEGAYAQVTFHVFTKTINNKLDTKLPLLTYSSPAGSYGAEPILLDFYLTNAPLHMIAQEDAEYEVPDWRIRITINGETFVVDQWQPIYLKGWKQGNNWVQLEFIDEQGNVVENVYNNTAKVFTYKPGGQDSLSKLMRGNLSVPAAKGIINPTYKAPIPAPTITPSPVATPSPTPTPKLPPSPTPTPLNSPSPGMTPTLNAPKTKVIEEVKPSPSSELKVLKETKSSPIPETKIPETKILEPKITKSPQVATPVASPARLPIASPEVIIPKPTTTTNSQTPPLEGD